MHNRTLAHAVRLAIIASGVGLYGATAGVSAQEVAMIEEIAVTGTRIRDANFVSSSPVTQIDAEEFQFTGATRVEDLLNTYPQISPSFDSFTVNPSPGFATADLRGLGSQRTLVLVNGHRLPPGGIRSQARDLNQIPAALVKRVEVLTGGASVVYGSDAMAGVVNFILDDDFEGLNVDVGVAGYQHSNSNSFLREKMDTAGFDYPTGSGTGGETYNIDLSLGSSFADGRGHAMAYATYRKNEEMRQAERDYSSCALNAAGTACGGSSTSPEPSFFSSGRQFLDGAGNPVFQLDPETGAPRVNEDTGEPIRFSQGGFTHQNADGSWTTGENTLYNFAPINHYQRPDERYTFGGSMRYEMNRHFRPYVETMFSNTNTSVQIAESGTFFVNNTTLGCDSVLMGSFCSDLGETEAVVGFDGVDEDGDPIPVMGTVFIDPDAPITMQVGKRNNEGGPRISEIESNTFRIILGTEGDVTDQWSYDASFLYARNSSNETNRNDFLTPRINDALIACEDPNVRDTPACYDVWSPNAVTPEAAARLGGVGARQGATETTAFTAYLTGVTDFTVPTAQDPISVVFGFEHREETYKVNSDTNMAEGLFTGLGGPRASISGGFDVSEFFIEAGIPLVQDRGMLQNLSLDLGYRHSHYNTSGGVDTYKVGATAQITDMLRVRGGWNRAIRAANVSELFLDSNIALWSGEDPCAGTDPEFTQAQCANTGVQAGQYGNIEASPASQYNQFVGGNEDLDPEVANTFTLGGVITPIDNLVLSVDYFSIEIEDRIGTIGAQTQLRFCGLTGDPFLCNNIRRGSTGDLWLGSDPDASGLVFNTNANFGELTARGLDFQANYSWNWLAGLWSASFNGTRVLKDELAPLPGVNDAATYDCAGNINTSCQTPSWRHTARVTYSRDNITGTLRWRFTGELDYEETNGAAGSTDQILVENGNTLDSVNYFDITGAYALNENARVTLGINNVFDKTPPIVGATLALNANSPGGYDQMGRYMHATFSLGF